MIARSVGRSVGRSIGASGFAVAGGGPTYLLDTYSGAAAAYSLRRLNTAYTGPVVQVRRSGDSAEDTFSAAEVGDGTLAAWVTAGGGTEDGFVKTWYDQSGNGNDASQATAASQPQIVASGAVVLENGKPSVMFNGTAHRLATGNVQSTAALSAFVATKADAWHQTTTYRGLAGHGYASGGTSGAAILYLTSQNSYDWILYDTIAFGNGFSNLQNPRAVGPISSGSDMRLACTILGPSAATININGSLVSTRVSATGNVNSRNSPITIGSGTISSEHWDGNISEFVFYLSDQSSNRTGIESNIASHYGITLS